MPSKKQPSCQKRKWRIFVTLKSEIYSSSIARDQYCARKWQNDDGAIMKICWNINMKKLGVISAKFYRGNYKYSVPFTLFQWFSRPNSLPTKSVLASPNCRFSPAEMSKMNIFAILRAWNSQNNHILASKFANFLK